MATKRFALRVLLTVTTGRLLTESKGPGNNGIGDLYDLLGWMTDDSPFTHQLPRFSDECRPWLLRWFPDIGKVDDACVGCLDKHLKDRTATVEQWLESMDHLVGQREFDVPKIPRDGHTQRDPVDELREMAGDEKVIVVETN